jgi:hypothetical protein
LDVNAMLEHLRVIASARAMEAVLVVQGMKRENGRVRLPVQIRNTTDAYEIAVGLQDLEDSWNNQEPRPHLRLTIVPAF